MWSAADESPTTCYRVSDRVCGHQRTVFSMGLFHLWLYFFKFTYFFFRLHHGAHAIFIPRPGIAPAPLAVEIQSLNHWTVREVTLWPHFITSSGSRLWHRESGKNDCGPVTSQMASLSPWCEPWAEQRVPAESQGQARASSLCFLTSWGISCHSSQPASRNEKARSRIP